VVKLKKQSQFVNGQNERKCLYRRVLLRILRFEGGEKTKPIKANRLILAQ
jgi:hypothetical protein